MRRFKRTRHLTRLLVFGAMTLASTGLASAQTQSGTPSEKSFSRVAARDSIAVRYTGRISYTPAGEALMTWSGTSATLRFEGTACRALFKSRGGLYRIFVDGKAVEAPIRTAPYDTLLWLAKDLPYGEHTVTVYKRTEAAVGTGVFAGFEIVGRALPASQATLVSQMPQRRIEFIGGSSLCGYGMLDTVATTGFSPLSQDHYLTYAAAAARRLEALSHTVAWSGMGLSRNAAGDSATTMPALWRKSDPTQPTAYDFRFKPEAVVIDLAVHDFAKAPLPDSAHYVKSLKTFIDAVRTQYPGTHIVLVAGSTLSDSAQALSLACRYHHHVAQSYAGKVSALTFTPLVHAPGLSASGWPNAAQHAHNADELVAHLQQVLAWQASSASLAPRSHAASPMPKPVLTRHPRLVSGRFGSLVTPSGAQLFSMDGRVQGLSTSSRPLLSLSQSP
jgi:Carbohydrate esterase 2 N-terminal